jgi:hypothetical protein
MKRSTKIITIVLVSILIIFLTIIIIAISTPNIGDIQEGSGIIPHPEIPLEKCLDGKNANRIIDNGTCYTDNRKIYACPKGECKYWSADELRNSLLDSLNQPVK